MGGWTVVSHTPAAQAAPTDPWAVVSHEPEQPSAATRYATSLIHAIGFPANPAEARQRMAEEEAKTLTDRLKEGPGGSWWNLLPGVGPGIKAGGEALAKGFQEQVEAGRSAASGDLLGALGHGVGSWGYTNAAVLAPLTGGSLTSAGEQAGTGDVAGAAGTATPVVAPFAVHGLLPGESVPRGTTPSGGGVRGAIRSTIGIGERFAQRTAAETVAKHTEATQAVTESNAAAAAKHTQRVARVQARQAAIDTETAAANKVAAEEHAQETARVDEINKAGQEAVGRRADLSRQIEADSTQLGQQVKALEKQVRTIGSGKYQVVADAVGTDTIPASDLADTINHAKNNIITGSEESIKQFSELLRKGEPQDVATSAGTARPGDPLYDILVKSGAVQPTEQLGFRDLQGYYTELGQRMQSPGLPGDVYRALKYVREGIGQRMQAMAESHGVGPQLNDAKSYWRQYEQTFHDMRAVSQGGSPVARVLRAEDPAYAAAPVLGKASARTVGMLARYSEEAAGRAAALARNHAEMQSLPKKFTAKPSPEAPEPKQARQLEVPQPPEAKPAPEAPDVVGAVQQARAAEVQRMARSMRRISGWDVASVTGGLYQIARGELPTAFGVTVLRHGLGAVLDHPRVAQWLSAPTAADFHALENIPDAAQRETVRSAVAEFYKKRAEEGRPIAMNGAAKAYLANAPKPDQPILGPGAPGLGDSTTHSISVNGQPVGSVSYTISGDTLTVQNIGGPKANYDAMSNVLGHKGIAALTDQLRQQHPEVKYIQGIRVGGAQGEAARSVRIPVSRLPQVQRPQPPTTATPARSFSGPERSAAIASIMSQLKNGEITERDADAKIQRLNGGGGRKLIRFPQQPEARP